MNSSIQMIFSEHLLIVHKQTVYFQDGEFFVKMKNGIPVSRLE